MGSQIVREASRTAVHYFSTPCEIKAVGQRPKFAHAASRRLEDDPACTVRLTQVLNRIGKVAQVTLPYTVGTCEYPFLREMPRVFSASCQSITFLFPISGGLAVVSICIGCYNRAPISTNTSSWRSTRGSINDQNGCGRPGGDFAQRLALNKEHAPYQGVCYVQT